MKKIIKVLLKLFWIFPLCSRRVVFRSSHGNKYNCNPKYISEALIRDYPNEFEIVWLFNKEAYAEHAHLSSLGIKPVKERSLLGLFYILTAGFIVDNHGLMSYIPVRKNQIVINTWHGGGSYKKEYKHSTEEHQQYMKDMYANTSLFISSCEKFDKCNLSSVAESNPEKILKIGLPRNDIMLLPDKTAITEKVKSALGIPLEKKIVLYAPTFRNGIEKEIYELHCESVCQVCSQRFGGAFVFVTRFHPFIEKNFKGVNSPSCMSSNPYEDMQELLCASDVLITDYSSCMWDASLAQIPCFIYAVDAQEYIDNRGFYTPMEEWPFPIADSQKQLLQNIAQLDTDCYYEQVKKHHVAMGSYETGLASKRMAEIIHSYVCSSGVCK